MNDKQAKKASSVDATIVDFITIRDSLKGIKFNQLRFQNIDFMCSINLN